MKTLLAAITSIVLTSGCLPPEDGAAGDVDAGNTGDDVSRDVADLAHDDTGVSPLAPRVGSDDALIGSRDAPTLAYADAGDEPGCTLSGLKGDFFASAAVCGFDAAKGAGTSFLKGVAVNLARGALQELSPGLADLLFGPADPFARGVAEILEEIGNAEQNIIANQVSLVESEVGDVSIPTIRTILESLALLDLTGKYGRFLGGEYSGLHLELTEVQQALQNRYDVFGLRSLHVLATVVSWSVGFEPELQVLTEIAGRGRAPGDLTDAELRDIQAKAEVETREGLTNLLDGPFGFLTYVRSLAAPNRFRQESAAQFSSFKECRGDYGDTGRVCRYEVSQLPDRTRTAPEEVTESFLIRVTRASPVGNEYTVTLMTLEPAGCEWGANPPECIARAYSNETVTFSGNPTTGDLIGREYERVRDDSYHRLVVNGYGPIRPAVDGWYRLIGRQPVQTELDRDLDGFLYQRGGLEQARAYMDAFMPGHRALVDAERRVLINYVLVYGARELEGVTLATSAHRWGARVEDLIRFLRGLGPAAGADAFFRGQFVAEMSAVL